MILKRPLFEPDFAMSIIASKSGTIAPLPSITASANFRYLTPMSEQKQKKGGFFGWFRSNDSEKQQDIAQQESDAASEQVEAATEESNTPHDSADQTTELQKTAESQPHVEDESSSDSDIKQAQSESLPELEPETATESAPETTDIPQTNAAQLQDKPKGLFARLKHGLARTRANFTDGLANLFLGKKQIDDELLEDLETQLLLADIGVEATTEIIEELTDKVERKQLKDPQALYEALKALLAEMIAPVDKPLIIEGHKPYVILMVGVNGVGKTTTIGKLAKQFQQQGKSVMLAAGDTFRAAAVEQLQVWGERNQIPVIAQHTGADSASVLYDALQAAQSRGVDVLIADTAGRLQTKFNLMDELSKVKRVMQKLDPEAPHEIMLTVDATTGQNALSQAEHFHKAVGITGFTISKLDGTAKGGVVFAVARKMGIPIRYIGVGEAIDDLRTFNADDFINALFSREES